MTTTEERFWAKVDTAGADECWEWTASKNEKGYGWFAFRGSNTRAHRAAYELLVGPLPEGLEVDHLCGNRGCVNPAHLEAVTHRENLRRGNGWPGENARKTVCVNGHPLEGDNIRLTDEGGRICLTCAAAYRKAYKERNRG